MTIEIGIILSNTCLVMLMANATTECPTYEEISVLFPDTTDPDWSGEFDYINGIYQRSTDTKRNHYEYYRYNTEPMVWIDPSGDVISKMKTITITSNNFIYPLKSQEITNSSFMIGQGRYIDNCFRATITANNWVFLLGDTFKHMLADCSADSTNFNEIKIRTWEATVHDITTSLKWRLAEFVKEVKENCLMEYGKCPNTRFN